MGKSRRGTKEFTREQRLVNENKRLKRELANARKQLARIDLDRYDTIREMVEEHRDTKEQPEFGAEFLENLKKTWLCNDCRQGYLEIIVYSKLGNPWYYRQCNHCPNRTKAQKHSPDVKGIIKKAISDE